MLNEQELKGIVCDQFLGGDISFPIEADTRLIDEGICDSLGLVRLAAEVERRCGIRVQDQEITRDNFGTMADILNFVAAKQHRLAG